MTPIPTDTTTVTQRMRGMKSEIKINPCQKFENQMSQPSLRIATKRGYLNLPVLTAAASDHPDAPELQAL
jgi:hypothetical protein